MGNCQRSQVMLRSYHGSLDGGAAVGQVIDVAILLLHNPAHCHRAHLQDRWILGALLVSWILHLRCFRWGHHFFDNQTTNRRQSPTRIARQLLTSWQTSRRRRARVIDYRKGVHKKKNPSPVALFIHINNFISNSNTLLVLSFH